MENPLVLKLEKRDRLSAEEKKVLEELPAHFREFSSGDDIVRQGSRPTESSLLLEGFAGRYKFVRDGGRQITALHVEGDFVDLHSFLLKTMDHGVLALSPCRVALIPHEELRKITERFPHLTRLLWLNTLIDGANHREWLVAMGRLSATEHTAHLLCEMFIRLQVVGRTKGMSFDFPLSQTEFGDTVGLSNVHVNRVLQDLRRQGLITWRGKKVTIDDWDGLAKLGEFDPTYLFLDSEPR